jgi:type II secretion system protein N
MAINLPKLPFKLPALPINRLGPRTRRILRYVGFALFALVVFVFALQATFPYDRAKDKLVEALSEKYEVTVGKVERGWMPGRVYFKAFTMRTRQTKPDETVTTFYIDKLEVDLGIFALIGGTIDVDLEATIGKGELSGNVRVGKFGKGDITATFEGNGVPADALPMRGLLGLPMTGKLELDLDIHLPMEKSKMGRTAINWQKGRGALSLACPSGCTFGDGKTKLKPLLKNTRNQAMVGDGIDFGKVTMDTLAAKVSLKGGKLAVDKFDTTSRDGQLKVDYMMTLEKEFGDSMVAGCLRFKGSDELTRREPKTAAAISTTGAELRGDGLFHIRLTGTFKDMKRLNQECGPNTNTNNGEDFSRSNRPNLTVQPDTGSADPAKPTMPAIPSPTPMPEQPTATPPAQDAGAAGANITGGPAGGPPVGSAAGGSGSAGSGTGERGAERARERDPQPGGEQHTPPAGNIDQPVPAPANPPPEQ